MENQKITPTNFVATVYGNLTPLNNSAFSKARLKIFYKGLNRNGSFITDEVAEKLLSTLPGTPVVGNFQGEKDDFEGHMSWAPEELKAYGFVPQDMNFNWEMSLDPDGVYRTYACTDIVLWTGRYPVASRIVGKSHSMELNPETVQGEWVETEDDFYFQFTNAEFFGLCVLGDEYEPCFEGSSFYELHNKKEDKPNFSNEVKEMFSLYKKGLDTADENQTGGQEMEDNENKPVEEEVTETPAEETPEVEETTTPEETNAEGEGEETEEGTETPEETEPETDSDDEEDESDEEESEESEEDGEEPDLNSQLAEKDAEIASLKAELDELNSYKAQKVQEEKEQVIETYSKKLSDEEVENFKNKMDEFATAIELKKEIAIYILDKESEEQEEETNFSFVKSHTEELKGAEAILAKYAKK